MNKNVMFSIKTDMWETPQDFFDKLNDEFHFTMDACAVKENAKCEKFYSPEEDALQQTWIGTVWCNPPYSRQLHRWVEKAYLSAQNGAIVVMLIPARTDTRWFHEYIYKKTEIRFVKGRLKFGGAKNGAPFPSMVVVFGTKNFSSKENE